ncbi:MAG: hypothetical protein HOQ05_11985 [Corynebacteriales bacterium]|nr:hypothetical protein [Mycobacteriales bacterium]
MTTERPGFLRRFARWVLATLSLSAWAAVLTASLYLPEKRAEIFLKYVQVLAWPSAVVGIVFLLRRHLPSTMQDWSQRLRTAELPLGIRLELDSAQRSMSDADASLVPQSVPPARHTHYNPPIPRGETHPHPTQATTHPHSWMEEEQARLITDAYDMKDEFDEEPPSDLESPHHRYTPHAEESDTQSRRRMPPQQTDGTNSLYAIPPGHTSTPTPPSFNDLPQVHGEDGVSAWALATAYDRLYSYLRALRGSHSASASTLSGYALQLAEATGHKGWISLAQGLAAIERVRKISTAEKLDPAAREEYLATLVRAARTATQLASASVSHTAA